MTDALLILLALALVAVILLRERANAAERQNLLDRIQAPEAVQMATAAAWDDSRAPKPQPAPWENIPVEGDMEVDSMLTDSGGWPIGFSSPNAPAHTPLAHAHDTWLPASFGLDPPNSPVQPYEGDEQA